MRSYNVLFTAEYFHRKSLVGDIVRIFKRVNIKSDGGMFNYRCNILGAGDSWRRRSPPRLANTLTRTTCVPTYLLAVVKVGFLCEMKLKAIILKE